MNIMRHISFYSIYRIIRLGLFLLSTFSPVSSSIISEPAPAQAFYSSKFPNIPSLHTQQDSVLYVAPSTANQQTRPSSPQEVQDDLPPPPPPPHVLQYQCNDYQNIHLRPLPKPISKPLRSQKIAKV